MLNVILIAVFISVAGLVLGLGMWFNRGEVLGRRLGQLKEHAQTPLDQSAQSGSSWLARVARFFAPIASLSTSKDAGDASYLRVRFFNAGLRQAYWPMLYLGAKSIFALLFPLVFLVYGGFFSDTGIAKTTLFVMFLLSGLGYYLPNLILSLLARSRQREIDEALPDAIDLMTVCVEAGLAIDAAMRRTCEELDMRSPALAEELNLVTLELQVGASREGAMRNLALRTGVASVATFVTILLQSGQFGTNIGDSLKVLSDTMREQRKLRAEEKAAKVPLKLLFPMIFFIFPALFVVLMGPAMISVFRVLLPTLGSVR
ncbi:MAG: type II secretion system F family protein [Rhodoferax sp.]